jgi:hypothetical protein
MFGLLVRLVHVTDLVGDAAAAIVQTPKEAVDPPWDRAGYEIAREFHDAVEKAAKKKTLPLNICTVVKTGNPDLWNQANDTTPVVPETVNYKGEPVPATFPSPHAKNYEGCKDCSHERLAPNVERKVPGGKLGNKWPDIRKAGNY